MATKAKTEWYKDNFLISTKSSLIQPAAVNAAMDSDLMYWTRAMDEGELKRMLDNSLCFGVYELPESSSAIAGKSSPKQIGLARLITDHVTVAYITDVYILQEYQGKGLGTWLLSAVDETLTSWKGLRRIGLMSSGNTEWYVKGLGVEEFDQGNSSGLKFMTRRGGGSVVGH
ncbi:acetyltransferase [Hyaloscypha variabilis F]|uniref:Acetyltransferase n=1 Tax=Hyaloscypha variabilis (strain UAMH 11265 / GT02V1 / F) TaxID=1149755 RepID=A0A2J6RAS0_HYAVF|nr:acetyltransferase [Hyaloscypha variabilis F]